MARKFTCGFEENSIIGGDTMWTTNGGNDFTAETTAPHSGSYHGRSNSTSGIPDKRIILTLPSNLTSGTLYTRVYFYFVTPPPDTESFIEWRSSGSSSAVQICLATSGSDRVPRMRYMGSTNVDGTYVFSTNTWYRVEIKHVIDNSTGSFEARFYVGDSTTAVETLTASSVDSLPVNVADFVLGTNTSTACETYFDDVAINDATGSEFNSWVGPGKIAMLKPNSDASVQFTGVGDTTNRYANVDDLPGDPDDTTTYNYADNTTSVDYFDLTDLPAEVTSNATMICFDVYARVGSTGGTARTGITRIKDEGGTATDGPSYSDAINGWRKMNTNEHYAYNLAGKTKTNVNAFQAGYKGNTGGSNRHRVTALWVNVEWLEATGVSVDVTSPIGISARVGKSQTSVLDVTSRASRVRTNVTPLTSRFSVARSSGLAITSKKSVQRNSGLPLTARSTTRRNGSVPLESRRSMLVVSLLPLTVKRGSKRDALIPVESRHLVAGAGTLPLLSTASVVAGAVSVYSQLPLFARAEIKTGGVLTVEARRVSPAAGQKLEIVARMQSRYSAGIELVSRRSVLTKDLVPIASVRSTQTGRVVALLARHVNGRLSVLPLTAGGSAAIASIYTTPPFTIWVTPEDAEFMLGMPEDILVDPIDNEWKVDK